MTTFKLPVIYKNDDGETSILEITSSAERIADRVKEYENLIAEEYADENNDNIDDYGSAADYLYEVFNIKIYYDLVPVKSGKINGWSEVYL